MRADDVALLEASAARVTTRLAEAMAATSPASGAEALPFRDGALIALGPGRYVNRALGVGQAPFGPDELAMLETFFERHDVPPSVELSSWAESDLLTQLGDRGYRPQWFRNVYTRPVAHADPPSGVSTLVVDRSRFETWRRVFGAAFEATSAEAGAISDEHTAAAFTAPGSTDLLAIVDGEAAGCGSVQIDGRLAWLSSAATLPEFRRRGVQSALIHRRLSLAADAGCDLALSIAVPAGASARNLEAHGFVLAYTQVATTRSGHSRANRR